MTGSAGIQLIVFDPVGLCRLWQHGVSSGTSVCDSYPLAAVLYISVSRPSASLCHSSQQTLLILNGFVFFFQSSPTDGVFYPEHLGQRSCEPWAHQGPVLSWTRRAEDWGVWSLLQWPCSSCRTPQSGLPWTLGLWRWVRTKVGLQARERLSVWYRSIQW